MNGVAHKRTYSQVRLDLESMPGSPPANLAPYVQRAHVRAASYAQLKGLAAKLCELPRGFTLALEVCFDLQHEHGVLLSAETEGDPGQ